MQIETPEATVITLPSPDKKKKRSPEQLEAMRRKQNLELSRNRVLHELERSDNERYKQLLNVTLADLEAQLAQFD